MKDGCCSTRLSSIILPLIQTFFVFFFCLSSTAALVTAHSGGDGIGGGEAALVDVVH